MAARSTQVGPAAVRVWAAEQKIEGKFSAEGARGRLPQKVVADYEKATGNKVVAGLKSEATVDVRVTKYNSKGHKRTRVVQKPLSEVRSIEGVPSRGVLSAASKALIDAHYSDPAPVAAETEAAETSASE